MASKILRWRNDGENGERGAEKKDETGDLGVHVQRLTDEGLWSFLVRVGVKEMIFERRCIVGNS
jgi:hypothetical protein